MAFMTTGMIDRGDPSCEVEAAICKVYGSEVAWRGVRKKKKRSLFFQFKKKKKINECIQVMGGTGFMKDWPFERIMRDTRILSIFEGTNEILRLMIALTGIKLIGDYLKAQSSIQTVLGYASLIKNNFFTSGIPEVHVSLKRQSSELQNYTKSFAITLARLLASKHHRHITERQQMLRRVADVVIHLYAVTAVLSRATNALNEGSSSASHEQLIASSFSSLTFKKIRDSLEEIETASSIDNDIETIADEVFKNNKYIPKHPTNI